MTWAIKHAKKSNTLVQYSQIPACRFLLVCYRGFALWLLWTVVTEKEKPLLAVITFSPFEIPASFPRRLVPVSQSHQESCAVYLFCTNSPFYIMPYQFPLISTHFLLPALLLSLFPSSYISSLPLGSLFK